MRVLAATAPLLTAERRVPVLLPVIRLILMTADGVAPGRDIHYCSLAPQQPQPADPGELAATALDFT